ncbi:unnamed protein product [Adineta steineri]|uniref:Doublecortin domain-containing protein n=1 Tax=Adineta steineri TaxID=433720 RepID=A0A813Z299_9BILA|nr:unnamed protein product [Adineta steineri]CAF3724159.1 unnamed protein product [Adineta steineri]
MTTEYDQHHVQRGGYQQYDQHRYQQHEQHGYQQHEQRAYPQYDQRDQYQQQQQQYPSVPERGRAIRLMRNGDPYFTGRTFVINQRKYPMFDGFLDDASQSLRANFGAVRCIYTPKHGTRLKDMSEFEDHRTYVAAGGEKFKKLHYLDIADGKRIATKGQIPPKFQLPPVRRIDVEGRAMKLSRSENVIIYVYRNGDPLTLPAKILLVKPTLQNWESVLDEITKKVSLASTAVLKLYSMNGDLLTSGQQLEYNGMYVAAGKERFKRLEYPDAKSFSANSSPKMSRKSYMKSDGTNTHTTNTATSYGSTETTGHRRPVREEYDFFNNKPQQHRRGPIKEIDLDRDDGGIYKGRLNHRERIREIDDTRDTKVDLPVDHRQVETVKDEQISGNNEKMPRRHPQTMNQSFSDARHKPIKSPLKNYNNDDNRYPSNNNNNHHTAIPIDDNHFDQHSPSFERRQSFVTSNTVANKINEDQAATIIQSHVRGYLTRKQSQQSQIHGKERNGYPYCQPSQVIEVNA